MSVTFWIPQAPRRRAQKPCEACNGTGRDDNEPCPYCGGVGSYVAYEYAAPFFDINVSNGHADALLAILDPLRPYGPDDPHGEWASETLRRVYANAMRALNLGKTRATLVEESYREGNFIHCGRDEDYVTRRLTQLVELIRLANEHGFSVRFG